MPRPEPAGDPVRNAAALVEGFADGDVAKRGVIAVTAYGEYHTAEHCPTLEIAMHLAEAYADLAAATGTDVAPVLARWRRFAEWLDSQG